MSKHKSANSHRYVNRKRVWREAVGVVDGNLSASCLLGELGLVHRGSSLLLGRYTTIHMHIHMSARMSVHMSVHIIHTCLHTSLYRCLHTTLHTCLWRRPVVYMSVHESRSLLIHIPMYMSLHTSIDTSMWPLLRADPHWLGPAANCRPTPSIHISVHVSTHTFIHTSIHMSKHMSIHVVPALQSHRSPLAVPA